MNNELRPYEDMKLSHQDWLNEVPNHWKLVKAKRIFRETSIKNYPDEELLSATQNRGVIPRRLLDTRVVMPMGNFESFKLVKEGNFVISLRSFQGGLEYSKYQGIVSPAYNVLEEYTGQNRMYFKQLMKSQVFISELQRNVTGIRQGKNIDVNDFKEIVLPIPPRSEQDQIVKYLDHQLAKIYKFIKTKKKLIAVLKEQKQAIINEAVTKGLDPNVKMKPSGIEWLGDVPEHWELSRCKYLFSEIDQRSINGDETHLSMSQKKGLVPDDQLDERRLLSVSYIGGKVCKENDIVLNRLKAHLGVFALAPQTGVVSPDYTILRANNKINPKFAELVLKSTKCRSELRIRVRGIVEGFWRLYTDDFFTIVLPLPKYHEQVEIINYIDVKSKNIDATMERIENEIAYIDEYKHSLISEVVTGKVDVSNIVIDEVIGADLEIAEPDEVSIDEESLEVEDGDE